MFGVQAVPLVGLGLQLVHLADLPLQLVALVLQIVLRGQRVGVLVAGRLPGVPVARQGSCGDLRVGVQQRAHSRRAGQTLPSVLAVDVQQQLAHRAQLLRRGRAAVDPGPAFAR